MPGVPRVFVDTNVLLYSVDRSNPQKQDCAWRWLDRLWLHTAGRLSWQVLQEFYPNATRKMHASPADTRHMIRLYAQWQPVAISMQLMERGWYWMDEAKVSYWDSLIVAAAERAGCQILLSEDFQPGRRFEAILVVNPFASVPDQFGLPSVKPVRG